MIQSQILHDTEFRNKVMLASVYTARNVKNESINTPNYIERYTFARRLLQNPQDMQNVFSILIASRYDSDNSANDPNLLKWEDKSEQAKKSDLEYLCAQVFEEAAYI